MYFSGMSQIMDELSDECDSAKWLKISTLFANIPTAMSVLYLFPGFCIYTRMHNTNKNKYMY